MKSRFSRDARQRARPGARRLDTTTRHHGDEFDEILPESGSLSVNPVRDYSAKVEQSWDDSTTAPTRPDLANRMGPLIEGAEPVVTSNSDYDSFLAAFDKRSNSQPDADDDCDEQFMNSAMAMWGKVFKTRQFEPFDVDDLMIERWLEKFDEPKRNRMLAALDRLNEVQDDPKYLGKKSLFVKVEALLKRYDNKWAPRLIYQGNDEFNALTGPVAMTICERLIELFNDTMIGPYKIKMAYKTNDVDLAEFLRGAEQEGFNECFEADFSANDLRQRYGANRLFQFVCTGLGAPQWFTKLLDKMAKFTVVNHTFGLVAELAHQLPTGTTITTPRNTVWNVTIEAVFALETHNTGMAICLGDDWLGMNKKRVHHTIEQWVAEKPKMKLTPAWPQLSGQATIISRRVCTYTERACMMPKLGKALARFNARASSNAAVSDSAYMAGKALSYAYEFRHFPLFRDLFLERFGMEEDNAVVSVEEVSWFTRTSGVDLAQLVKAIKNEPVIADEDQTREFLMDSYGDDFGLVDALAVSRAVICSRDHTSVVAPPQLEIDF